MEKSLEVEGKTGVEMEAMTGVSVTLLTIYDMCKAIDKRMEIALLEIARANEYDYIVVNDDLTTAVLDVIAIIRGSKYALKRQKNIIDEVLLNVKS